MTDPRFNIEIRRNTTVVAQLAEWWIAADAAASISALCPTDRIDLHDTITGARQVYRKGEMIFPM